MPYIPQEDRARLDETLLDLSLEISSPGELNYVITKLVDHYAHPFTYAIIAEVTGVLENVKQEFYRRKAAPYEDRKLEENGDVYRSRRRPFPTNSTPPALVRR